MAGRQGAVGRTTEALADSARDRATIAARKAKAKVLGHRRHCPDCGKSARTAEQVTACRDRHKRERNQQKPPRPARSKDNTGSGWGKPKAPHRGHHSCGCGKTFRNDLELRDHARQHAEREDRAGKRKQERDRRAQAVNNRKARGGRPNGAPKDRTGRARDGKTSAQRKAEWHGQRMQHAAGRVDRDGKRIPHTPSPRKVRPRTPTAPNVH